MTQRYKALALVASDGEGNGCILAHVGLYCYLNETGSKALWDVGLDAAPYGLYVWEGWIVYTTTPSTPNGPEEYDEDLEGEFRALTPQEWDALKNDPPTHINCGIFKQYRCKAIEAQHEDFDEPCDRVADPKLGLCEKHFVEDK